MHKSRFVMKIGPVFFKVQMVGKIGISIYALLEILGQNITIEQSDRPFRGFEKQILAFLHF